MDYKRRLLLEVQRAKRIVETQQDEDSLLRVSPVSMVNRGYYQGVATALQWLIDEEGEDECSPV